MNNESGKISNDRRVRRENENNFDEEITRLSAYLRELKFTKERTGRDIRKNKEQLKKLEAEIARKESLIKSDEKRIDICEVKLKEAIKARTFRKVATPYRITSFNGKRKETLYVGDKVYTNDGQGIFKGRFIATVVSLAKQKNRVVLRFDGVYETTTRDVKFLRHTHQSY